MVFSFICEVPVVGVEIIQSQFVDRGELQRQIDALSQAVKVCQENQHHTENQAKLYFPLYKWGGLTARLAILYGMASLVVFAIFNFHNVPLPGRKTSLHLNTGA